MLDDGALSADFGRSLFTNMTIGGALGLAGGLFGERVIQTTTIELVHPILGNRFPMIGDHTEKVVSPIQITWEHMSSSILLGGFGAELSSYAGGTKGNC